MRKRTKTSREQNEIVSPEELNKRPPDFVHRESLLTVLIKESLHIRAIYHIFIVILLVLLCDTVIYNLVEHGKINMGLSTIIHGFGDITRAAKLWSFDLAIALAFYPGLRVYAAVGRLIGHIRAARFIWKAVGVLSLAAMEVALIAIPVRILAGKQLPLASSAIVTCEMFRFTMKIHAATVACAERCFDDGTPLPSFKHYLYFLFAPTLVYKDEYPRTKTIRWTVVLFHFVEVGAIILYISLLWERFMIPLWSDYGKEPQVEVGSVVRGIFSSVLPGVISFLCAFYGMLHSWYNAFGEMLKFADRLFYEDWWTTSQFSKYYRAWNRIVYAWLHNQIYKPIAPYAGRTLTTMLVFIVSAVAHEVILSLSFGFFYPILFIQFGVLGFILMPLTATGGLRFPHFFNLLMWLGFFIGNGLLWSLYAMEHFARQNCPPSDNDSFFIPKSWSCPEIILKPKWTFKNPLDKFYF